MNIPNKKDSHQIVITNHTIQTAEPSRLCFSAFIKEHRKNQTKPNSKKTLTTRDLAKMVGIDYEQFRKIINMNKPTKKRDCIIAICAALRLDSEETNKALISYQYMPSLDSSNPRDNLIIEILEGQFMTPLTISEINQRLNRNGFPELDIIDRRTTEKHTLQKDATPYKILKKEVSAVTENLFVDQYDSLSTKYSLYKYLCYSKMWLVNPFDKKKYKLSASSRYPIVPNSRSWFLDIYDGNNLEIKSVNSDTEAGLLVDYFRELESMANQELKKMLSIINDTKNYHTRISAGICEDMIHIYAESYNYNIPELNEYCLFEYKKGQTILSVYHKSEFMHCYLLPDEYTMAYGSITNPVIAQYTSIEEIEKAAKNADFESYFLLKWRAEIFKQLKLQADSLLSDLRNKKQFIRRLDFAYDEDDRVCEFFDVKSEFKCTWNEYGDMIIAGVDSADFYFDDCGTVTITLDDLRQSFELGFSNIHEICRVKKELGSIEKIL